MVEDRIAFDGCDDACRNANEQGKQDGANRQLDRGGKQCGEFTEDLGLGDDGFAQITLQTLAM
jgi:hypothetical protein